MRSDGQLVSDGRCDAPEDLGPLLVVSAQQVLAVTAGIVDTCAVRPDGQIVGFGWCDAPEDLGPVLAVSAQQVLAVTAGIVHTCAVRSDGQLLGCGHNTHDRCDAPQNLGPVLAVTAGIGPAQCGQMVNSSALERIMLGSADQL